MSKFNECKKFNPNIFNKQKCSNCYRLKKLHSEDALEVNKKLRNVLRCGYLSVAPNWDFSNPANRSRRWQRRWFVLYDDGELTYSVDDQMDTIPQAVIDLSTVLEITPADTLTGNQYSMAVVTKEGIHFIKGSCKEESRVWLDILRLFPKVVASQVGVIGRAKRSATFPGIIRGSSFSPSEKVEKIADEEETSALDLTTNNNNNANTNNSVTNVSNSTKNNNGQNSLKPNTSVPKDDPSLPLVSKPFENQPTVPPIDNKMESRGVPDGCGLESDLEKDTKRGWLMMETKSKEWHRYWFVLEDFALMYYRDPIAESKGFLDGVIDLGGVRNIIEFYTSKHYGFRIETFEGRMFKFTAITNGIRSKWINSLKTALNLPMDDKEQNSMGSIGSRNTDNSISSVDDNISDKMETVTTIVEQNKQESDSMTSRTHQHYYSNSKDDSQQHFYSAKKEDFYGGSKLDEGQHFYSNKMDEPQHFYSSKKEDSQHYYSSKKEDTQHFYSNKMDESQHFYSNKKDDFYSNKKDDSQHFYSNKKEDFYSSKKEDSQLFYSNKKEDNQHFYSNKKDESTSKTSLQDILESEVSTLTNQLEQAQNDFNNEAPIKVDKEEKYSVSEDLALEMKTSMKKAKDLIAKQSEEIMCLRNQLSAKQDHVEQISILLQEERSRIMKMNETLHKNETVQKELKLKLQQVENELKDTLEQMLNAQSVIDQNNADLLEEQEKYQMLLESYEKDKMLLEEGKRQNEEYENVIIEVKYEVDRKEQELNDLQEKYEKLEKVQEEVQGELREKSVKYDVQTKSDRTLIDMLQNEKEQLERVLLKKLDELESLNEKSQKSQTVKIEALSDLLSIEMPNVSNISDLNSEQMLTYIIDLLERFHTAVNEIRILKSKLREAQNLSDKLEFEKLRQNQAFEEMKQEFLQREEALGGKVQDLAEKLYQAEKTIKSTTRVRKTSKKQ